MIFDRPAEQLNDLPVQPGVYRFTDKAGKLLYVGKAKNLANRIRAYFEGREHGPHIKKMVPHIHRLEIIVTPGELEALLLEQRLISQLKPKYNIIFRDDKTYTYVSLSKHAHPQIRTFRGKRSSDKDLFGPYVDSRSARARVEMAQKAFQIRTCDDGTYAHRSRPCVLHQIGRCSGPCVPGLVSDEQYQAQAQRARDYLAGKAAALVSSMTREMERASELMEFEKAARLRDQVRLLSNAQTLQNFEGRANVNLDAIAISDGTRSAAVHLYQIRDGLIHNVFAYELPLASAPAETYEALLSQHYLEREPPARVLCSAPDQVPHEALDFLRLRWGHAPTPSVAGNPAERGWLDMAADNARRSIAATDSPQDVRVAQLAALKVLFPAMPGTALSRIECFDISHFHGEGAVASCVVYEESAMRPDLYRLYNIAPENAGDDFASMKEAIVRRYQSTPADELPHLVIVDGGAGQLTKAREALAIIGLNLPLLGIAKGVTRKLGNEELLPGWDGDTSKRLDKGDPALLLLSHIRDEAHRFAITRNRKTLAKRRTESHLLEIPGVGASKRKALLLAFGSSAKVREASIEQLAMVPGIGTTLARQIKVSMAPDA